MKEWFFKIINNAKDSFNQLQTKKKILYTFLVLLYILTMVFVYGKYTDLVTEFNV